MADGTVAPYAADSAEETPSPEEVMEYLMRTLQCDARDGKIRATGICYNGRIVERGAKVDAIIANLEHASGNGSTTVVPYKKGLFGKYKLGTMSATRAEPRIFLQS